MRTPPSKGRKRSTYAVRAPASRAKKQRGPSKVARTAAKQRLFEKERVKSVTKKEKREALHQWKVKKKKNYGLISDITVLWEKLRPRDVPEHQRQQFLSLAMTRVKGRILELVQNPKASRVLQCCLRYGAPDDRQVILDEIHRGLAKLSMSKYGKHLVQKLIARTAKEDFARIFRIFPSHAPQLLKHQYGSDVMNDLYCKCTALQQHALILACYGHVAIADAWEEEYEKQQSAGIDPSSFETVFGEADPVRRAGALQRLHGLLNAVIEKGLLVNRLVHRLILEFFRSAPAVQVADLSVTLAETGDGLLKMVHTKEGSAVAAAVVRYSDASHRKTTLRGFKDYVKETAFDEWGHVVLLMAFRVVDDTKMLRKTLMQSIVENVEEMCSHRYARRVILDLLHPCCQWYLPDKIQPHLHPRLLEIPAPDSSSMRVVGVSKKDDLTRRRELLCDGEASLEEALLHLCSSKAATLLKCRRGSDVLVEVARGAEGGLLNKDRIKDVHQAIIDACIDTAFLTDRISKGAIIQLVHFSTKEGPSIAKLFCKSLWKKIVKGNCRRWMEPASVSILASLLTCGSKSVRSACRREVEALLKDQSVEEWLNGVQESKLHKRQEIVRKRLENKKHS